MSLTEKIPNCMPASYGVPGRSGGRVTYMRLHVSQRLGGQAIPVLRCSQASRVAIFQAPMIHQPTIQPAMTVIMAQVGIGGRCSSCGPPPGPIVVPPTTRPV